MAVPLHESPYFVLGVTDVAYTFDADEFGGGAFRVFGISERFTDAGTQSELAPLNWYQAERACADVGIGLAAVANSARKKALDAAMLAAEKALPATEPYFWIGGYRTSLSDPGCTSGPVTKYPYFTEYDDDTYNECGKHQFWDWAWSRPSADGSFNDTDKQFIPWREHRGPEQYWDTYERTGVDSYDPQPTGWTGPKILAPYPEGGLYENCTAAQVFTADDPDVKKAARGRAYYDDYPCLALQSRWLCEMRDAEQGVDEGALLDRQVPVLGSPYYIPGVTSEGRMVNSLTYFRIFGVTPTRAALFKNYDWDDTTLRGVLWPNAREACITAGGTGLAVNRFGSYSTARAALMSAASSTLSLSYGVTAFQAWLGGATTVDATAKGSLLKVEDFTWYEGMEASYALESEQQQWTKGWPKAGPDYVAHVVMPVPDKTGPDNDKTLNETSCIASVWDPALVSAVKSSFQNFICNDPAVKYFVCTFPSEQAGMTAPSNASAGAMVPPAPNPSVRGPFSAPETGVEADSSDSQLNSNVAPVVGGAVAGFVLLAVIAVAGFFVIRRRRRRGPHSLQDHYVAAPVPQADSDVEAHLGAVSKKGSAAAQSLSKSPGNALQLQTFEQSEPSHITAQERDGNRNTWVTMTIESSTEWATQSPQQDNGRPAIAVPAAAPPRAQAIERSEASTRTTAASQDQDARGGVWVTMTAGPSTEWTAQSMHQDNVYPPGYPAAAVPCAARSANDGTTIVAEYEGMEPMTRLQAQLEGVVARGGMFAKKYMLSNVNDSRKGGQGAVYFSRHRFNGYEYAIKFFLSMPAFFTEKALYESPQLQRILPNIEDMADPLSPERDHHGLPMPPYIVMERGEALDEWSMRANPDLPTTCQVLSHLATRLEDLHAARIVHRDLKPGNVMWLPRENRWTIIDFGCVANAGSQALISYSLSYAAPEVIAAADALQAGTGPHTMLVTPALDAWSLGVMIFRMLTTPPGEPMRAGVITIEMLRGKEQLPWEGPNLTQAKRRSLGVLRTPVLKLLSRDPALRSSMAELKAQCDDIFAGKTTNASGGDAVA